MTLGLETGETIMEALNLNEGCMKAYGRGEVVTVRGSRTRRILFLIQKQLLSNQMYLKVISNGEKKQSLHFG